MSALSIPSSKGPVSRHRLRVPAVDHRVRQTIQDRLIPLRTEVKQGSVLAVLAVKAWPHRLT